MADVSPQSAHALGRRSLLRNGLLAGLGLAAVSVMTSGLTGTAQAAPMTLPVDGPTEAGWAWCSKCRGLFYAFNSTTGDCPAGGQHGSQTSYDYEIPFDNSGGTNLQPNWKWCGKCEGMFYGPNESSSHCPAGGTHNDSNSDSYSLFYDYSASSYVQLDWNHCTKCQGLFYGPQQSSSYCPAGGTHNAGDSFTYDLQYSNTLVITF
jgi:hypothetical protein